MSATETEAKIPFPEDLKGGLFQGLAERDPQRAASLIVQIAEEDAGLVDVIIEALPSEVAAAVRACMQGLNLGYTTN